MSDTSMEIDPTKGTFAGLTFPGGVGSLWGTWQLRHVGFGEHFWIDQDTGDAVPAAAVNVAKRKA